MGIDYTLYFVADAGLAAGRELPALVEAAVAGGATLIQLRAKGLAGRAFVELGTGIARALAGTGVPLIVNDRLDVALACGAAGVHLGQDDLPVPFARRLVGPGGTIGVSVNTPEEARRAEKEGADYVGAGPAFATASKETGLPVLGPEGVGRIKRAVGIPVVAIGGISAGNAAAIAGAGADGIAVISAILSAPDARRAAAELRKAFSPSKRRQL
jgi:thiamine-phosphate pyrophosphorylase